MEKNVYAIASTANADKASLTRQLSAQEAAPADLLQEKRTNAHSIHSTKHFVAAWKPIRLDIDVANLTMDEKKTQELYRKITGVLNKLTPSRFEVLTEKIHRLEIDTVARLQGFVDLVFEKAIKEPEFCELYAQMCYTMQSISIVSDDGKNIVFRTLIITKSQQQLERNKEEELDILKKQREIDECRDPEQKKKLELLLEEVKRKRRVRLVSNCRFTGELFKLQMLSADAVMRCISKLLRDNDEELLEGACRLLAISGKLLEQRFAKELLPYFAKLQDLSERIPYLVSSRIRFMIQDLLDLRKDKWIPRREASGPRTIDQLDKEFEKQKLDIKLRNLQSPCRAKNHRNRRSRRKASIVHVFEEDSNQQAAGSMEKK